MQKQFSNLASMSELATGFPTSTEAFLEASLDLNERLLRHPTATFYMRVSSNRPALGLLRGDLGGRGRAEQAKNGNTVVALRDGELFASKIKIQSNRISILSERSASSWTAVQEGVDFEIWGVVLYIIRELA